ncbi:MAG: non-oxidative hydroxyarylic acid decarboxylases subunit D [Gammaproteobacteria bacterium]
MNRPVITDTAEGGQCEDKQCPRCEGREVIVLARSPVGKVWEMYLCDDCQYSWRSTETEAIQNPDLYSKKFKLK